MALAAATIVAHRSNPSVDANAVGWAAAERLQAPAQTRADDPAGATPPTLPDAPAPARERWVKTPLAAAFDAAADLRAFALEAQRRPAEGGVFHALRALAECRLRPPIGEPHEGPADAATLHLRLHARAAWNERQARRCASFTGDDLADAEVERLAALGSNADDPLAASYALWLAAVQEGTMPAIANALAVALDNEDAGLLELIALTGQDYLSAGSASTGEADEAQARVRHAAWQLLPCELGAGCAPGLRGAVDELCERSVRCSRERWRSGPRLDPLPADAELARTLLEVARLRTAIREGNVGAVLGLPGAARWSPASGRP